MSYLTCPKCGGDRWLNYSKITVRGKTVRTRPIVRCEACSYERAAVPSAQEPR